MIEKRVGSLALEKIKAQRSQAVCRVEEALGDIKNQSENPDGFAERQLNRRLGVAFMRSRAEEMMANMDIRHVRLEDLGMYQPLFAAGGTGFSLSRHALRWAKGVISFTEDIARLQTSWVILKTEVTKRQERCLVIEAEEPELDDWIRLRRAIHTSAKGSDRALPFLLHEEAMIRTGKTEPLHQLSLALLRRE